MVGSTMENCCKCSCNHCYLITVRLPVVQDTALQLTYSRSVLSCTRCSLVGHRLRAQTYWRQSIGSRPCCTRCRICSQRRHSIWSCQWCGWVPM